LLELDKSGIHVAEYLTVLPPREVLQEKLNQSIQQARSRLEQGDENATRLLENVDTKCGGYCRRHVGRAVTAVTKIRLEILGRGKKSGSHIATPHLVHLSAC